MPVCVFRPQLYHLGLLLQLLESPCQVVKVNVVRGGGIPT